MRRKKKESACLAFELISYGVSLFSFVGGTFCPREQDFFLSPIGKNPFNKNSYRIEYLSEKKVKHIFSIG